jgi:hypothetical protein
LKSTSKAVPAKYTDRYQTTVQWPVELPFPEDASSGERRFEIKTTGCGWDVLIGIRGLAVWKTPECALIYGDRSMLKIQEDGYTHRGYVSVGGKLRRVFTSSQLFEHAGKLYDFAVLHVT